MGRLWDWRIYAQSFPNVRIETGEFIGFGPTRNHAASFAKFDWILAIDADECLDDNLHSAIDNLPLERENTVYQLRRHNYFLGKKLRFGAQANNKIVRLYHRGHTSFNKGAVHEKVLIPDGTQIQTLCGFLEHNPIASLYEQIQKMNAYSELPRGKRAETRPATAFQAASHGLWAFFRSYVLFLGVLDGWRGLVCAVGDANGRFYKYMKRVACQDPAATKSLPQTHHKNPD